MQQILTNEKYIGNNVYDRRSFKLKQKRVANGPEMWIRSEGAFDAIVELKQFQKVQAIIAARNPRFSDEEMLERLNRLYQRHGYISGLVIDEADGMPSSGAYAHRFGSLIRAYSLVGFTPDRDYHYIEVNRLLRLFHGDEVERVIHEITRLGGTVTRNPVTDLLTINGEFTASVAVARCRETSTGGLRWKIRFDTGLVPDITIAIRMERTNTAALDYYLLPQFEMRTKPLPSMRRHAMPLGAIWPLGLPLALTLPPCLAAPFRNMNIHGKCRGAATDVAVNVVPMDQAAPCRGDRMAKGVGRGQHGGMRNARYRHHRRWPRRAGYGAEAASEGLSPQDL